MLNQPRIDGSQSALFRVTVKPPHLMHLRFPGIGIRLWLTFVFVAAVEAIGGVVPPSGLLVSEGGDPFRIGLATSCNEPFLAQRAGGECGGVFLRAMDATPDGQQILGVSDDELYAVDVTCGPELLGQIGFSAGRRFWFMECAGGADQFDYAKPGATGPIIWYFRANVVLNDLNGDVVSEFEIEQSGIAIDGSQLGVLVDELLEEPGIIGTQLTLSLTDDGVAQMEFLALSGGGDASVDGVFVALTPNAADAEPIPLPVVGLTIATNGTMFALSDAQRDPFGEAALYELNLSGTNVAGEYVSTPDAQDLECIEFADDGRLFGAGSDLHLIDPITGASALIASLSGDRAVELDYDAAGRLSAIARRVDGSTVLLDISPGEPTGLPLAQFGAKRYWGLIVLDRDPADLDGDGDVDGDDMTLFDAEFTGELAEPFVPAGVPEPKITRLIAPHVQNTLACSSNSPFEPWIGSRYRMDATDIGSPGVIVEGSPTAVTDTSIEFYLAHNDDEIQINVQVVDDDPSDQTGDDVVELYFDTNNSDSLVREGDVNGFQATMDSGGVDGGDAAALSSWCSIKRSAYQPGFRLRFTINKSATNMVTGGTYGFDLAARDTDEMLGDEVRYFFFSDDLSAEQDESQWGSIFLAPGPLPPQASDPIPDSGSNGVNPIVTLGWSSAPEVDESRVYLGVDPQQLVFQETAASDSFIPEPLSAGSTYYWRIDQVNTNGLERGKIWRFTTSPSAADIDRDGDVDEHDQRRLFQRPSGDATGDGLIDDADYAVVVSAFGSMAGDPAYDAAVDYDSDGAITSVDLGIWQCRSVQAGNSPIADFDGDGDEDDDDLIIFTDCLLGPVASATPECMIADLTLDNHVELGDVALLQQILIGAQP